VRDVLNEAEETLDRLGCGQRRVVQPDRIDDAVGAQLAVVVAEAPYLAVRRLGRL
jgi:hypothetical protein